MLYGTLPYVRVSVGGRRQRARQRSKGESELRSDGKLKHAPHCAWAYL